MLLSLWSVCKNLKANAVWFGRSFFCLWDNELSWTQGVNKVVRGLLFILFCIRFHHHSFRKYIDEPLIWKVLYQVSSALRECHNCSKAGTAVLHRDLKPANVFLDANNNCKLGDFGLARVLHHDTSFAKTFVGTPYYMSPVSCLF